MNPANEVIHARDKRQHILTARQAFAGNFGESRITRRVPNGLVTEEFTKAYETWPCNCYITSLEELGPPCPLCFVELVNANVQSSAAATASAKELEFIARPCSSHSKVCVQPCCGASVCPRHGTVADDNLRFLCLPHLLQANQELADVQLRAEKGELGSRIHRFMHSLFDFDKEDV